MFLKSLDRRFRESAHRALHFRCRLGEGAGSGTGGFRPGRGKDLRHGFARVRGLREGLSGPGSLRFRALKARLHGLPGVLEPERGEELHRGPLRVAGLQGQVHLRLRLLRERFPEQGAGADAECLHLPGELPGHLSKARQRGSLDLPPDVHAPEEALKGGGMRDGPEAVFRDPLEFALHAVEGQAVLFRQPESDHGGEVHAQRFRRLSYINESFRVHAGLQGALHAPEQLFPHVRHRALPDRTLHRLPKAGHVKQRRLLPGPLEIPAVLRGAEDTAEEIRVPGLRVAG